MGLFLVLALFLVLQLSSAGMAPVKADNRPAAENPLGWYEQYYDQNAMLLGISAADKNTCWAVGNNTILKTSDGGANWTPQTLPAELMLNSVSAVDANVCWASGVNGNNQGVILRTTNGGSKWETIIAISGYTPSAVSAVDAQTCWVAGYSGVAPAGGYIARTINGGASWELPKTGMAFPMTSISAVDKNICWAVGGRIMGGPDYFTSEGAILKTSDGGANWTSYGPYNSFHAKVSAVNSQVAWVLGLRMQNYPYNAYPECYITVDGGGTWKTKQAPLFGMGGALCAVDADTAWCVGSGASLSGSTMGLICKTTDGGANWALQASTLEKRGLMNVCALDADTAWAAGYSYYYPSQDPNGCIMHTTDGGWPSPPHIETIDPASGAIDDVIAISGTHFGPPPLPQYSPKVLFGNVEAGIVSWSDTLIKCKVPEGLTPGQVDVTVKALGGTSNAVAFTSIYATIIRGRVSTTDNLNLPGIEVNVYDLDHKLLASTLADSNGQYKIVTTLPDTSVKIEFKDPNDVCQTEWYRDKPDFASADLCQVKGGKINELGLELLDYYPPTVSSLTPDSGEVGSVVEVTIHGSRFREGCVVELQRQYNYVPVTEVTFISPTRIDCKVDLSDFPSYLAGSYDVRVRNADNQEGVLPDGFTVTSALPLKITSITPNSAARYSALDAELECQGFRTDPRVRLEGKDTQIEATSVSIWSDTRISCHFELGDSPTGAYDVVLENPDGQQARLPGAFTITPESPLAITSIEPPYGYQGTTPFVRIACTGFSPNVSVRLERKGVSLEAGELEFSYDPPQIACVFDLSEAPIGWYDVVLENPDGKQARLSSAFEVTDKLVMPDHASQCALQVDLKVEGGYPFEPGMDVKFIKGNKVIDAYNERAAEGTRIACSVFLFGAEPGVYNLVVYRPHESPCTPGGTFTVTPVCGTGSGSAVLMAGITLGLFSLAGSGGILRRRRRRRKIS